MRPYKTLKVVYFAPGTRDHAGTDFDDFHFFQRPAAVIGGGFQVNYQPVRHVQLSLNNIGVEDAA